MTKENKKEERRFLVETCNGVRFYIQKDDLERFAKAWANDEISEFTQEMLGGKHIVSITEAKPFN